MKKYQYEELEKTLIQNSPIPLAVYQYIDGQVKTVALSKGFMELFNLKDFCRTTELMDTNIYRDCHPDDIAALQESAALFATKDVPYNVIYRSKVNGAYKIIHAFGKHVKKGRTKLAIIWYSDEGDYKDGIEQKGGFLEAAYSNLLRGGSQKRLLEYDYLTGLPTTSNFLCICDTTHYPDAVKNGDVPVMIFLDFVGMRRFNSKFGFAEGDKLLQAFSRLLTKTFGSNYCSRFGIDRFYVFTTNKNVEKRLSALFEEAEKINGGMSLPLVAGIYSSEVEVCGASFACDRAKAACESIKNSSKSKFAWFDKEMLKRHENSRYIIENIDRAIAEDWIKVYYQPIVRATNGRVCDEEALARWIDPERGFMSPADFIPVLEDAKLIYKLDLYVTEQVLKKMKAQKKAGIYLAPISVNLSRSDFDVCDIVEEIHKRVKAEKIPPEKITIEITESIMGSDFEYMKGQARRFQELGFNVWMDDFGSGYSSLEVLHEIRFDLIKFDMKFMQNFETSEKSKIMLSGLIKIAAELGMETVCEGVETAEQVEFLKEIGCSKLQGYYYCKPIPMEEIFERYEKGTQIGFENPAETEYYAQIGKINLYNLSVITNANDEIYKNVFNTPPMLILEADDKEIKIVRGNKSYKEFMKKNFRHVARDGNIIGRVISINEENRRRDALFFEVVSRCRANSDPIIIDQRLGSGELIHIYIRRVSTNPVSKVTALAAVILGVMGSS